MASRLKLPSLALLVIALALMSGCIFSPDRKAPSATPKPLKILAPISPQNVLSNLVTAYVARDSAETDSVYYVNYRGESPDLAIPYSRSDERRHVGRLKLDPNIVTVLLDLGSPLTWQVLDSYVADPPGSKIITITSQTVRIEDIFQAKTWLTTNQTMEYVFIPIPVPGAPADQDTTWKVYRWKEY